MKSRLRYIIPILYIMADVAGIFISFYLAYQVRFFSFAANILPVTRGIPNLSLYLQAIIFVVIIWVFIFGLMGHYKRRSPSSFDRFWEVIRGVTSGIVLIVASTFFYRGESFSRLVMAYGWLISIIVLYVLREIVYRFELAMFRRGDIVKRAVIIGDEPPGLQLYGKLKNQPAWGILPVGFISSENIDKIGLQKELFRNGKSADNAVYQVTIGLDGPSDLANSGKLWLGRLQDITDVIIHNHIDLIIFNLPHGQGHIIEEFVLSSDNLGLEYMLTR
jgi:uncharacterized membrane protein (UPF0136 family)